MLNEEQAYDYEMRSRWSARFLWLGGVVANVIRRYVTWRTKRRYQSYVKAKHAQWAAEAKAKRNLRLYRG